MTTLQPAPADVARAEFDRGWRLAMAYAIRLFWQGVCLDLADGFDKNVQTCVLKTCLLARADGENDDEIATWNARAERCRARAAQYREWADGKESKPLYEVQTRPWLRGDDE